MRAVYRTALNALNSAAKAIAIGSGRVGSYLPTAAQHCTYGSANFRRQIDLNSSMSDSA